MDANLFQCSSGSKSIMGVLNVPGAIVTTLMPNFPSSLAMTRVMETIPPEIRVRG